jgi:hypothetical protein
MFAIITLPEKLSAYIGERFDYDREKLQLSPSGLRLLEEFEAKAQESGFSGVRVMLPGTTHMLDHDMSRLNVMVDEKCAIRQDCFLG